MDANSRKILQENRDYTMFSWSVQSTANPIHMKRGQGVWFWDGDDNRWLDFSSQLINLNLGHQHPKCWRPSRSRWTSCALQDRVSRRSRAAHSEKNLPKLRAWRRLFSRWVDRKPTKTL